MPGPTQGRLNLNPRWPFWDTTRYAAAVDAAAAPQVYDKTGFAAVGLVAAGDAATEFAETGFALTGGVATGVRQEVRSRSGFAIAGGVGTGASQFVIAPPLTAGFETGVVAATVTTGDPGDATAWDFTSIGTGASLVYDNTHHARGVLAMKAQTTGTAASARAVWIRDISLDHHGRLYIYMQSWPSAQVGFVRVENTAGTHCFSLMLNTNGTITILDAAGAFVTTTNAVAVNKRVRVEWHAIASPTVGSVEVKLFNEAESGTATETLNTVPGGNTGSQHGRIWFGIVGIANIGPWWIDSIVARAHSYPGRADMPYTELGAGLAAGVTTGAKQTDHLRTGNAIVGTIGAGDANVVYAETGFGKVGTVGAGVSAFVSGAGNVYTKTGFAAAGLVGAGADADFTQETGFAVAGLVGSGASSSVFTRTGLSVVGLVGSGPSASVFVEAGNGSVGTVGAAPSESLTQETGVGVVGTVGAGFVTRAGQTVKTGAGACGLVGAGTSASVFARLGNAIAGTVATGGRARELARTGLGQVGTVGAGVALRAATSAKAGFGTVAGTALGASASLVQRLGNAVAGLVGSGSETRTSGAVTAKTGAGAAGTVGSGPSASVFSEAGSAAAVLVARGSRAVVYVQGSYAILSGTGTGVRTRTIARTGVGFLGVTGFGDNIEHFDAEPPGYVVGSHTGQPNRTTTGRRTVSIATILTSTGNGRLTRSKTGELV